MSVLGGKAVFGNDEQLRTLHTGWGRMKRFDPVVADRALAFEQVAELQERVHLLEDEVALWKHMFDNAKGGMLLAFEMGDEDRAKQEALEDENVRLKRELAVQADARAELDKCNIFIEKIIAREKADTEVRSLVILSASVYFTTLEAFRKRMLFSKKKKLSPTIVLQELADTQVNVTRCTHDNDRRREMTKATIKRLLEMNKDWNPDTVDLLKNMTIE
jgi:hypothetical protein